LRLPGISGTLRRCTDRIRAVTRKMARSEGPPGILPLLGEAERKLQAGDPGAAGALCRQVLVRDRRNAAALHLLGMIALRLGNGADALRHFNDAVKARPDFADAHYGLGVTQRMAGRPDAAAWSLQAAVRLRPDNPEFHNSLGNLLAAQHRHREAAECYGAAVRLRPDFAELRVNLGITRMDLQEWAAAEESFRHALALDPRNVRAHANLGVALRQQNRTAEAIASLENAVRLAPGYALAHTNLGLALQSEGRAEEALRCHDAALAAKPDYAEAHSNRGAALTRLGRAEEAVASCRIAVQLKRDATTCGNLGLALQKAERHAEALACFEAAVGFSPDSAEANSNLGVCFIDLCRYDEAIAALGRAVALDPDYAEAYSNLGSALMLRGNTAEAIAACGHAVSLEPTSAEAHSNLGGALQAAGRLDDAIAECDRAIAIDPALASAHAFQGLALQGKAQPEDALAACLKAIEINPKLASAHVNGGNVQLEMGRTGDALAFYRRAVALKPDLSEGHCNLGATLLLLGEYEEGWKEYEWRFESAPRRPFPQRYWSGEDLAGRRLLVWGEQGIGDELLFFGFVPELMERGAAVVVECSPRLVPLLTRSFQGVEVFACSNPPHPRLLGSDIDFQVSEVTAAAVLRPSRNQFRPLAPYVVCDADVAAGLRRAYGGGDVPLVGISWFSGNPRLGAVDTLPLADWLPILKVPGVRFVNLQYGDRAAEIAAARQASGADIVVDAGVDPLVDMDRAAAQMAAMDLVITINNATAQMASTLGRPVWNLLAFVADWRMGLEGDTSPWYHGMRLFRQHAAGAWGPVVAEVTAALGEWLAEWRSGDAFAAAQAHHHAGRPAEAMALYQRVLDDDPSHLGALYHLGLLAGRGGDHRRAVAFGRRAVAAAPDNPSVHNNLGVALMDLGRADEAADAFRAAIALAPDTAAIHYNLGRALKAQGRLDDAVAAFRAATALMPGHANAHDALGTALAALGRPAEAVAAFEAAVALEPERAAFHCNLGNALVAGCRPDAAAAALRRALELAPDQAEAHDALASALAGLGRLDEAVAACRQAVALAPDSAAFHTHLANLLLRRGDYRAGWDEFEWRFQVDVAPRDLPQPRWRGQDLAGRRLLVWGEQGIGDQLLFYAFVPELVERGATVVVECSTRLVAMLERSLPGVEVVPYAEPPNPRLLAADIDFQVPEMSVAAILRPSRQDFRPLSPYLKTEPAVAAELRRAYGGGKVPLVGVAWWSGNPNAGAADTVPLAEWSPILTVPGLRFVSLQYSDRGAEIAAARQATGADFIVDSSVDPLLDLDRAAAQIAAMDLVVTINNATAQMASILGRPAWNMLAFTPDWRMGPDGDTSPWYDGMRLFRQPAPGAWGPVVAEVAAALGAWAAGREAAA